ncbi:MAG: YkvA family protein, partial [Chloroflexota bacterium]|nr:YkvA family protein [Chloroflexota bacterium]
DMLASVHRWSRAAQDHPVVGPYLTMVTRLPSYARLGAELARDPDVPAAAKASLVAAGVYAISPVDLVPGIVPVAGQMDDLAALLLAIRFAIRLTPKEVAVPHMEQVGLTQQQLDEDLAAIRTAALWLARKAANSVRDFASTTAGRVTAGMRRLATR